MKALNFFLLSLLALVWAQPAGWQGEPRAHETGIFYQHPDYPNALIRVATLAELNEANGSTIFTERAVDAALLREALSVFWIDLMGSAYEAVTSQGQPLLWGHGAYTEDGERSFAIHLAENGQGQLQVVVFLAEQAQFEQLGGAALLEPALLEPTLEPSLASHDAAPAVNPLSHNPLSHNPLSQQQVASSQNPTPMALQAYSEPFRSDTTDNAMGWAGWQVVDKSIPNFGTIQLVSANPRDPAAPFGMQVGILWDEGEDDSFAAVFEHAMQHAGLSQVDALPLNTLEAAALVNHSTHITMGHAYLGGQAVTFYIEMWRYLPNQENVSQYFLFVASESDMRRWGGVLVGFDSLFGASPAALEFVQADNGQRKLQIGNLPFAEQLQLTEEILSAYWQENHVMINQQLAAVDVAQSAMEMMLMQQQMRTVTMLQDMNTDMILGRDYWETGSYMDNMWGTW